MAFYGKSFVFDGIPSELYNLTISSLSGEETSRVADVELITTKIYRRPTEYLYGVSQNPVLQFPIVFHTPENLSAEDFGNVSAWLFGQQNYKKLQIFQDDMYDMYFNCFLVQPELIRVGNIIRGVKAVVRCDSPFAYTFPQTAEYTYGSPPSSSAIIFTNYSQNSFYIYPEIQFTMTASGGNLSITNTTDSGRIFSFTGLAANEVITVNNDLQIITSSLSLLRLPLFNKKFFRLLPGKNVLSVTGSITNLKITYSFAKKIGG